MSKSVYLYCLAIFKIQFSLKDTYTEFYRYEFTIAYWIELPIILRIKLIHNILISLIFRKVSIKKNIEIGKLPILLFGHKEFENIIVI